MIMRNGYIHMKPTPTSRCSWSEHAYLSAAVFEDGSLTVIQLLSHTPGTAGSLPGSSMGRGGSDAPDPTLSSSCLLANRLHPILPTAADLAATGADTAKQTPWTMDVVSRFLDAALLDSSMCPAVTGEGLDPRIK